VPSIIQIPHVEGSEFNRLTAAPYLSQVKSLDAVILSALRVACNCFILFAALRVYLYDTSSDSSRIFE
jgi:hypothetical protein